MSLKKKIIIIILISALFFTVSCNEQTIEKLKINIPEPEIDYNLMETVGDWQQDPTGHFSYLTIKPRETTQPYFGQNLEFPGNIFIYEIKLSPINPTQWFGYINQDNKKLTEPISLSPNIFMYGFARVESEEGSYIINTEFQKVEEYYPGYVLSDNSLVVVSWTEKPVKNAFIIANPDPDEYLVPYIINPTLGNNLSTPVVGYKTLAAAHDSNISVEGNFVIPAIYEEAGLFRDGIAAVKYNGKWGLINESGDIVADYIYDDTKNLSHGVTAVFLEEATIKAYFRGSNRVYDKSVENRWALVDADGNFLTEFEFIVVDEYIDGLACAYTKEYSSFFKATFINTEGIKVVTNITIYKTSAEVYSEGFILHYDQGSFFFDSNGNDAFGRKFKTAAAFSDGMAVFKQGNYWGYIDTNGKTAILPSYRATRDFSSGYAFVIKDFSKKGAGYLIDKTEKKYLEGLGLYGITKFNEDGYALGYGTIFVEGYVKDPGTGELRLGEVQNDLFYMIHVEQP